MNQKLSNRQIAEINLKGYGKEPTFDQRPLSVSDMCTIYAWYHAMKDYPDAVQYLKDYCGTDRRAKAFDRLQIDKTYGWLARVISRGANVQPSDRNKLEQYISRVFTTVDVSPRAKVPSNDNRTSDKIEKYLPIFEEAVDSLDKSFDPYKFLSDNAVPQSYAARIGQYYTRVQAEIQLALDKKDVQCIEAYSHLKVVDLRNMSQYYSNIIAACETFVGNSKKVRKPRKAKAKSSDQILKHFKHCSKFDKLQLVSIDPLKIIGAQQLFVYNVANNVFTAFFAKDDKGLTINRSSIGNYDEAKTCSKRAGKRLKDVVEVATNGSKKQRGSIMDLLSTGAVSTSNRINTNVVILKAYSK